MDRFLKGAAASAWNARAQLMHQSNRLVNLELLHQHGAKLWIAKNNELEASAKQLEAKEAEITGKIEALNRKRKADQLAVAPKLQAMEAEWVASVKKNLEIEAKNLQLEAECEELRKSMETETSNKRKRDESES